MHLLVGWEVAELDMLCGDSCMQHCSQGPGKRPAVFSHDKLVWELAEDALEAARLQNGVLPQKCNQGAVARACVGASPNAVCLMPGHTRI